MYEVDIQNTQTRVARELTAGRILRVVHSRVYVCMWAYVCVYEKVGEIYTCARTRSTWIEEGGLCRRASMSFHDDGNCRFTTSC